MIAGTIALLFAFTQSLNAQEQQRQANSKGEKQQLHQKEQRGAELQGPFANYSSIPGLNEKQKADIKTIRIEMLKDIKVIKDKINEKEASLRTLTRAEKYDSNAAEKIIDEIAALQAENRKRVEKARSQIRSMINDEQKIWFDQHCQPHPAGQKKAVDAKKQGGEKKQRAEKQQNKQKPVRK